MVNAGETIKKLEKDQLRADLPQLEIGDTVKMKVKVSEGEKTRLHPFEGTVISKRGRGISSSFTVRKISYGEGVERTFPLHSPVIESLEVVSKGIIKRAKLYYLRDRIGKKARVKKKTE